MWEAALSAVENIFGCPCVAEVIPRSLAFLVLGVVMGLSLGAIPGLGGLVGLAILLPFTLDLDTLSAFAVMIGLISVTTTSDTIPSVLFGVPGTAASQATILDGHPMAKKGEAGRAFGAAYMASMMGGLFGALILAVLHPRAPSHRARVQRSRVLHDGDAGHLHGGGAERRRTSEGAGGGRPGAHGGHGGHGLPGGGDALDLRPALPLGRRAAGARGPGHLRHPGDGRPGDPRHPHRRRAQGCLERRYRGHPRRVPPLVPGAAVQRRGACGSAPRRVWAARWWTGSPTGTRSRPSAAPGTPSAPATCAASSRRRAPTTPRRAAR